MTNKTPSPLNANPELKSVSVQLNGNIGDSFVSPAPPKVEGAGYGPPHIATFQMMQRSGPLPDPVALSGYAAIDPSLPDRIMAMAERGHEAQIAREKDKLQHGLTISLIGRFFALIFCVLVLALAAYIAHLGFGKEAAAIVIAVLGTAVYTIISGRGTDEKINKSKVDEAQNT